MSKKSLEEKLKYVDWDIDYYQKQISNLLKEVQGSIQMAIDGKQFDTYLLAGWEGQYQQKLILLHKAQEKKESILEILKEMDD